MADIGEPIKRIEVEPLHLPPIETPKEPPVAVPEKEKEPARVQALL